MSLQRLLWVSVKITHNNYHELQGLVIKSLDDLDKVLLLISLGIDTKELQEMIDGDCLDTL